MLGWQAMNHADLDQLLILQEKDVRISKLRKELASLPEQRTRLLKQMEAIKQKALAAKQEVAGIEKSIRDVEAAVETKRAYIGKMKTLQSNTRKNEEYQRCIQEVEKTEAAIDSLETSELELMERLETANMLTVRTAEHGGRIRKYYHITSEGLKRIEDFKVEWKEISSIYRFVTKEEDGNE